MEFFIKRRETWIWFVRLGLELNKGGLNTVNKIKKVYSLKVVGWIHFLHFGQRGLLLVPPGGNF